MKGDNRRAHARFALIAALEYRPANSTLHSVWKRGRAVDMSASGLLIEIPDALPLGSKLELAMDWPGLYYGRPLGRMLLNAIVARVDQRGTALRIVSHQFRDMRSALVRPRRLERSLAVAS